MRTLIVGSGFVGRAVAARLATSGGEAVLASRRPPAELASGAAGVAWTELDVTDRDACRRVVPGADAIVLVHGPSDVTWCDGHPEEAMHGHATATRHVAEVAGDRRIVLISTDNVFDGTAETCVEGTPTNPANGYGRAKLAAERALDGVADRTVLRVSLIYGWEPADSTKWLNFFASCAHRLRAGEPVRVPYDQWTTPVLIDDVAAVTEAVLVRSGPPLLHLGGPERISRAGWARVIADELGAPADLVIAEPRAAGRYADRPASTCLSSTLLRTHPATAGVPVRGVRAGTRDLLAGAGLAPPARAPLARTPRSPR